MVLNAQRTIYAMDLALASLLTDSYTPSLNTTLNEKFNIYPNESLPDYTFPKLKYYAIGIGENDIITSNSGYNYSTHNPSDAALFEHIPFVMRELDNDLLPNERVNYRFRTIETFNNKSYACYYLKLITNIDYKNYFYKISSENENNTLSIYSTNTDKLLNPTPVNRAVDIGDLNTTEYISKLAKLEFSLDTNDLEELNNVLTVLNKTDRKLTEIGVCYGMDKYIADDNITEAISTQIGFHIGVNIDTALTYNSGDVILRSIEIGGAEPLVSR